ncbi:hypothetical protein QQ008_11090 [Fulvivirgaceae bacterium BMA10]|uniref:Uncharacterized protein n=1 Tax=Splendidivirga corallicola TaxID=3051826 RepID=A0ABT8KQY5_9BACT|nr:hypothetical protein [Fulvivirgaceae bacterium BMA10]
MSDIIIALLIGTVAGIIDTTPMVIRKMYKYAILSVFVQWVVLGLIIPFVDWHIQPWLKGLIIGEIAPLPAMIMVFPRIKKMIVPMIIFHAILGIGIALAGARFIG